MTGTLEPISRAKTRVCLKWNDFELEERTWFSTPADVHCSNPSWSGSDHVAGNPCCLSVPSLTSCQLDFTWPFYFCRALGCSQDTECLWICGEGWRQTSACGPVGSLGSPRAVEKQRDGKSRYRVSLHISTHGKNDFALNMMTTPWLGYGRLIAWKPMCTKLMKSWLSHTTHLKSTAEMAQKKEKFIPKGGGQNPENISLAVATAEAWGPTLVLRARLGHVTSPGPQVERISSGGSPWKSLSCKGAMWTNSPGRASACVGFFWTVASWVHVPSYGCGVEIYASLSRPNNPSGILLFKGVPGWYLTEANALSRNAPTVQAVKNPINCFSRSIMSK